MQYMMQPLGGWGAGRCLGKPLVGWLHWSRSLAGWLLWAGPWRAGWSLESWLHCWLVPGGLAALLAGPWRAGCAGLVPGGLAVLGWSLEGWLHCWLVPGGLVTLLVPVSPNMLKMCSFNSLSHSTSVEKQLGYSFKVQVLAVIY